MELVVVDRSLSELAERIALSSEVKCDWLGLTGGVADGGMPSVVVHSGAHQFPAVAASGSKYIWAHFGGNRIVNIESIYKLQAAQLVTLKLGTTSPTQIITTS